MRLVQAHLAEFMIADVKDRDFVGLLQHLHSKTREDVGDGIRPTLIVRGWIAHVRLARSRHAASRSLPRWVSRSDLCNRRPADPNCLHPSAVRHAGATGSSPGQDQMPAVRSLGERRDATRRRSPGLALSFVHRQRPSQLPAARFAPKRVLPPLPAPSSKTGNSVARTCAPAFRWFVLALLERDAFTLNRFPLASL